MHESLEEIKEYCGFYDWYDHVSIYDMRYLIAQAERVKQLEQGYKDIISWGNLGNTYSDISAAITFQDIARKALAGYKEDEK